MKVHEQHCLSLTHCVLLTLLVAWRLTERTQQRCWLRNHYPALFSFSLCTQFSFKGLLCLCRLLDSLCHCGKLQQGRQPGVREHCLCCSTLASQPQLRAPQGERKHVFIPLQALLDAKFYLKPKQSQIAYWETFPHISNRLPWNPQTSLAGNKYLQIQESGGNAMGNLSMFHFLTGMTQPSSDG